LGNGPGAILNEDGTVNSPDNPAAAGSLVALYVTGLGQTDPPGQDGVVAGNLLPRPQLPVSVFVSGLPADILYAAAAPGMVAGVFQLNVRVPATITSWPEIPVSLQAGTFVSPSSVWVAVQ
jgi:uncharacterized protein (TIGR03437 family)